MSSATTRPYLSLEEFLELEAEPGRRLEWSAGLVQAMSGGSPEHGRISAKVIMALSRGLDEECTIFGSNTDLWIDGAQFYGQADATIVCGALQTHVVKKKGKVLGEAITNPVVVVEVLSPSTEARDRGEKFEAYKQIASLREYVLVSQDERRVEVRRRTERGFSSDIAGPEDTIRIHGQDVAVSTLYE